MEAFLCHLKPFNSLKTKSPITSVCRRKGKNQEELQKATESTLKLTQPACFPVPEQCGPLHSPPGWTFAWWHQTWRMSEQQPQRACSDLASSKQCPRNCRVSVHGISGGTRATGKQPLFQTWLWVHTYIHAVAGAKQDPSLLVFTWRSVISEQPQHHPSKRDTNPRPLSSGTIPAKRYGACFFRWQEWEHFPLKTL